MISPCYQISSLTSIKKNMGQCVSSSLHKNPDSENKYDHQPFGPQGFPLPSPVKDKSLSTAVELPKTSSYSYGSKEEAFFDTLPWLDSDCDDDFFSVNGDFTPSRGNTPLHHHASAPITRSPYWNSSGLTSPTPGPSPSPHVAKKSLSDLFEESGRYVTEARNDASSLSISLPASAVGSPYIARARSSYSGGRTPKGNAVERRVRSFKSVKCCLPRLLSSQSFDEGKRVIRMSPVLNK